MFTMKAQKLKSFLRRSCDLFTGIHVLIETKLSTTQEQKQPTNQKMGKGLEQTFFQRQHTNGQPVYVHKITKHQGNAIKTTMRQNLTPVRMANFFKKNIDKFWQGGEEIETPVHC